MTRTKKILIAAAVGVGLFVLAKKFGAGSGSNNVLNYVLSHDWMYLGKTLVSKDTLPGYVTVDASGNILTTDGAVGVLSADKTRIDFVKGAQKLFWTLA
jgi:hypothetical protein